MAAFWDERWSRWSQWAGAAMPWLVAALLPPLLVLGALWFRRDTRTRRAR
jgi:hypothetical protein